MKGNFETLQQLASKVELLENEKQDFVVPSSHMKMIGKFLEIPGQGMFGMTNLCEQQMVRHYKIPMKYYNAVGEIPGLQEANMNGWLKHDEKERRMVRVLENNARAFLSDRFKTFDNAMMLGALIPVLKDVGNIAPIRIVSNTLTDRRMCLQVIFPKIEGEVKVGDMVQFGVTASNSEVGLGAWDITELMWRLSCSNGMIGESIVRKYHVGRKIGDVDDDYEIFADDTIKAELEAFKLKVRDLFKEAIKGESFKAWLNKVKGIVEDKVEKPQTLIKNVTKKFILTNDQGEKVLTNMANEGNMSRYGLMNGLTALARDLEDQNKAYDLEKAGAVIVNLSPSEWKVMSEKEMKEEEEEAA